MWQFGDSDYFLEDTLVRREGSKKWQRSKGRSRAQAARGIVTLSTCLCCIPV